MSFVSRGHAHAGQTSLHPRLFEHGRNLPCQGLRRIWLLEVKAVAAQSNRRPGRPFNGKRAAEALISVDCGRPLNLKTSGPAASALRDKKREQIVRMRFFALGLDIFLAALCDHDQANHAVAGVHEEFIGARLDRRDDRRL